MQKNTIQLSYFSVMRAISILAPMTDNIILPLRNIYAYDFAIEKESKFFKVKVINTFYKRNGNYELNLRKSGGYSKNNGQKAPFDNKMCDFIFAVTPEKEYFIPTDKIKATKCINLSLYEEYLLPHGAAVAQLTVNQLVASSNLAEADLFTGRPWLGG